MAAYAGKGPKGWSMADERLIEEVSERLMQDRLLDARGVEVAADAGTVTLSGHVAAASDIALAAMLVRGTPGVRDLVNRLVLQPGARAPERPTDPEAPAHYEGRWGRWIPPFTP
ncbi:MAG TPA: BON domain-containing protein [Phenylobacterium sp.]